MTNDKRERRQNVCHNKQEGSFIDDGFTILRKAIPITIQDQAQNSVIQSLKLLCKDIKENTPKDNNKLFSEIILDLAKKQKPYDILKPVWENLVHEKIIHSIFTEEIIFQFISNILGKDLCHQDDPSLTLNLPGISNSNQNYLFKGYHQEVWSGADIHTIQFWTPLFQNDNSGGIVLVKSSHHWGHIPHKNREPIELPKQMVEIHSDLEIGDVIIFHSLLLHRTSPIKSDGQPRLAIPCLLKNFRMPNNSFETYRNWKIFSYSDLSQIDRRLGNHYLSPFRLLDIKTIDQQFDKGIK